MGRNYCRIVIVDLICLIMHCSITWAPWILHMDRNLTNRAGVYRILPYWTNQAIIIPHHNILKNYPIRLLLSRMWPLRHPLVSTVFRCG